MYLSCKIIKFSIIGDRNYGAAGENFGDFRRRPPITLHYYIITGFITNVNGQSETSTRL